MSWESTNTTVSIADTAGNTYVPLTKKKSAANNQWVQKFYCLSATGNAANVVTATWASAADFRGIDCASYSYSGTASFDNEGNGDQAAGTTLTMTLTPTGTGSNLLTTGIKSFNSNTFQNGYAAGWNSVSSTMGPTELHHAEDQVVTGTAPVNGGAVALSSNITGVYAIYKEAAGGAPSADDDQCVEG